MKNTEHNLKKNLITGLVILLPIAVTVAIIGFLIDFMTKPFIGFVTETLSHFEFMQHGFLFLRPEKIILYLSKVLIIGFLFLTTLGLGIFTRWFFINSLLSLGDAILQRIPIVNTVYKTSQDIIKTLFVTDKNSFQKVVMVPFPNSNTYVLGLLVRESPKACSETINHELISVLVPTTPNPTTGFLMMIRKEEILYVDIRPEDAIKYIVSCGVITPKDKTEITKKV